MLSRNRILIIIGIFLIVIGLIAMLARRAPTRYNWLETYKETSKQPYGTHILYNLLEDYFPTQPLKPFQNKLSEELPIDTLASVNMNYVFIGEGLYMDSLDVDRLLNFVDNGHTAFISSKSIPHDLMFFLYYDECNEAFWDDYTSIKDTIAGLNFIHESLSKSKALQFSYNYRGKITPYQWTYMRDYYFCEDPYGLVPLGYFDSNGSEFYNFARVQYGKGYFYLHTTPLTFSNIAMLEKRGLDYANGIFSHLSEGPIFWDSYSRISEATSRRRNNSGGNRSLSNRTPLQYILSQPPLAWAWYTLLVSLLLYLLFMAKRRQRIIPVIEENKNTSLEFLKTIGSLYFLQNNHKQLCIQKMRLFKSFVKDRYQITIKSLEDEEAVNRLAVKSEVSLKQLNAIFSMYRNIESASFVSENTLIDFHQKTDYFYKNCK